MPPSRRALLALALVLAASAGAPLAHASAPMSHGKVGDPLLAKRILTRIDDYPGGWSINAGSKPSDSGCFSKPERAHAPTARAQASPDFIDTSSQERSGANVSIYASPRNARAALQAVSAPGRSRATARRSRRRSGAPVSPLRASRASRSRSGPSATR